MIVVSRARGPRALCVPPQCAIPSRSSLPSHYQVAGGGPAALVGTSWGPHVCAKLNDLRVRERVT